MWRRSSRIMEGVIAIKDKEKNSQNEIDLSTKIAAAIERLKAFEPEEGYYLAFSGGKDSQCVYHLCEMAGVKFDSHYSVTSVDPPELVQFIKTHYPDVSFEFQHYSDGKPEHYYENGQPKPVTMWSLICDNRVPPSRRIRYCCRWLKEPGGEGRVTLTGVRWAESANRKNSHGVVSFRGKPKRTAKMADKIGTEYKTNKHGDVILNDDNDEARRMVEQCYRTRKTLVNPIIDWTDDDVWGFIRSNHIEYCSLYDEGFKRIGCIGCPMSGSRQMIRDFERWPKYKNLYIKAFERMIERHAGEIKVINHDSSTKYDIYEFVDDDDGESHTRTQAEETATATDSLRKQCTNDGSWRRFAEAAFERFVERGSA